MPKSKSLSLVLLVVFLVRSAAGQPSQSWAQGDPTAEEQQAMEWLNAARHDPVGCLTGILNLAGSDSVIAGFMLAENPVTAAQLEQSLQANDQTALADSARFPNSEAISGAPLVFYPLFQQQAAAWGAAAQAPAVSFPPQRPPPAYIYPVPFFGGGLQSGPSNLLTGPNATGGTAAFGPYGANYTEVSQANLYSAVIGPREWMLTQLTGALGSWSPPPEFLLQGDSLPNLTLGHTRMAGIAVTPGTSGNRILTVFKGSSEFFTQSDLPFGNTGTVFITGVAYQDANSNGVYDPGEGLAGIRITPDHGAWYAVTSASGGYAIPVPVNFGATTLTASGGPLDGATATVTVDGDSVKVDWVLPAAAVVLPPQVPVPSPDGATQLTGLSTRGLVQTGDGVLIGGFVIAGPAGAQKKVLIRGVGPSLQTTGFPASECIPATQIQVCSGATVIASNNGWTTSPDGGAAASAAAARVGDFPLIDWAGGGGDSALVEALAPGAYTVIVSPAPGTAPIFLTGQVGLVEIYDVTPADGSRLSALSSRGPVGAGDDQLIAGCSVSGNGHERLMVRGVGPGLNQLGLTGTLANPALALADSQGQPIAGDDDWSDSAQTDQIRALAAANGDFALPEGSVDAALLALLGPGNYTALVSAQAGTAPGGIALVEIYEAP